MFLSILTPTYNRKELLVRLYDSLMEQTDYDFEWIIFDDGSKDETIDFCQRFINDKFEVVVKGRKENKGKYLTLEEAISFARGEYCVTIDSDDCFVENGIQKMKWCSENIKEEEYAGFFMLGADLNTKEIKGKLYPKSNSDCRYVDELITYNMGGDNQKIFKTKRLKEVKFYHFDNERYGQFEALSLLQLNEKYKFKAFNIVGRYFEYRKDGLTNSIYKHYRNGCKAMYERYRMQSNQIFHLKSLILMVMYSELSNYSFKKVMSDLIFKRKIVMFFLYAPSCIFNWYCKKNKKLIYQ